MKDRAVLSKHTDESVDRWKRVAWRVWNHPDSFALRSAWARIHPVCLLTGEKYSVRERFLLCTTFL